MVRHYTVYPKHLWARKNSFQPVNNDVDEEEEEEELKQQEKTLNQTPAVSPLVAKKRYPLPKKKDPPSSGASSRKQSNTLSLSEDVLSSMSRSFENRPAENEKTPKKPSKFQQLMDWSIDPDGVFAYYWKAAVTAAVIYNCAVIILRIAFAEKREEAAFGPLDFLCDMIFVMDFVIEAKMSFLNDGCMVKDSKETYRYYKENPCFAYDVISVLPIHSVVVQTANFCSFFPIENLQLPFFWEHLSVIQLVLRLNRLLKCHAMNSFFMRTESRTNNPNLLRAFKLSLHLGLVIHWIACLYYMLSEYEGLGSNEWVYPSEPSPVKFSRKYILCMFWSTMTLTTIGERPPPATELEYIFTGLTFLIGVFVFAAVVGNVGDVISNMNAARRDFQARMDQIKFYMDHRSVPEHLQNRIKRWAEYTWDRTKAIDEPNVLQFLPDRLRTEVAIHVHLDILKKVSIFDECEEGLLRELVLKLKPQIFSPGDYICRIGEIGREMYIINHGKVEILFPDSETGTMKQVAEMHSGNFFGEISLLKLDDGQNKRTADVRSIGFSELLCLSRRDLMVALTEYPEAKKVLEDYARQRFNNTRKLTPPETDESRSASPRISYTSLGRRRSARQVFAQVMKQDGFAKLLANATKTTELLELKTAVEELKSARNAQVEESFIALQRKVQDLESMVLEKNLELQESRAQVGYLETVINRLNHHETNHIKNPADAPVLGRGNSFSKNDLAFDWPDLHRVSTILHDMQRKQPLGLSSKDKKSHVKKKYFFGAENCDSLASNGDENVHCTERRSSFRTMAQKNVNSNDTLGSLNNVNASSDPTSPLLDTEACSDSSHRSDKTVTQIMEEIMKSSRPGRRASAPHVAVKYSSLAKTSLRKCVTSHDSSRSLSSPLSTLKPRAVRVYNGLTSSKKKSHRRNSVLTIDHCEQTNSHSSQAMPDLQAVACRNQKVHRDDTEKSANLLHDSETATKHLHENNGVNREESHTEQGELRKANDINDVGGLALNKISTKAEESRTNRLIIPSLSTEEVPLENATVNSSNNSQDPHEPKLCLQDSLSLDIISPVSSFNESWDERTDDSDLLSDSDEM